MARSVPDDLLGALAEARALGFLGPGPLEPHVASAERFADAIAVRASAGPALDLGSGGGVPGLLLAAWFAEWPWVLLDAQRRRTSFLAATVGRLGQAPRVSVVRARAETAGHGPPHRESYAVVTARSFGSPPATAEAASAFVRPGGVVVIAEPPGEPERWDPPGLAELGLVIDDERSPGVQVLRKVATLRHEFPRGVTVQRSRPLF